MEKPDCENVRLLTFGDTDAGTRPSQVIAPSTFPMTIAIRASREPNVDNFHGVPRNFFQKNTPNVLTKGGAVV